jgi:hypothetical protein
VLLMLDEAYTLPLILEGRMGSWIEVVRKPTVFALFLGRRNNGHAIRDEVRVRSCERERVSVIIRSRSFSPSDEAP